MNTRSGWCRPVVAVCLAATVLRAGERWLLLAGNDCTVEADSLAADGIATRGEGLRASEE